MVTAAVESIAHTAPGTPTRASINAMIQIRFMIFVASGLVPDVFSFHVAPEPCLQSAGPGVCLLTLSRTDQIIHPVFIAGHKNKSIRVGRGPCRLAIARCACIEYPAFSNLVIG